MRRSFRRALFVTTALGAALLLALPATANTSVGRSERTGPHSEATHAVLDGDPLIVNRETIRLLDSNDAGNVYTLNANGSNYQEWYFVGYTIRNRQTNRCLDSNYNGNVYTVPCNGGNYQNWYITGATLANVTIRNRQTNRCLDSNHAGNVYTLPCNGSNYQNWDRSTL